MSIVRKTDIYRTDRGNTGVLFKEFTAEHKGELVDEQRYGDVGEELLADIREFLIDGTLPSRGCGA